MSRLAAIPLAEWANRQLRALADDTGSARIAALTGAGLLGERALLNGFRVPNHISAGGGCRLLQARDGWLALSLVRPDDRASLPALFGDAALDAQDDEAIAARIASASAPTLVARGAELGLAIASTRGEPDSPVWQIVTTGLPTQAARNRAPLVVDLSALWAGPLATHLLGLAGATVIKVETPLRPDALRHGDPALFGLLNHDKASVVLDLTDPGECDVLCALIRKADIVVEASRPRALLQLGIDAGALVADVPGLVWMSITAHGIGGDSANRIGFGDDCGVAGGLSAALLAASGSIGFVGDAIADPLTGIVGARRAWAQWQRGAGGRIALAMSGVVRMAIADERARDALGFDDDLRAWAAAQGAAFPPCAQRPSTEARAFGFDTAAWLDGARTC